MHVTARLPQKEEAAQWRNSYHGFLSHLWKAGVILKVFSTWIPRNSVSTFILLFV